MEWSQIMTQSRVFALAAVLVLAVFLTAAPAFAQEAEDEEAQRSLIAKGGWVGIIILCVSVVTLALVIQYFVNMRRDKICPPELVDELEALLEEEEYQEALELCEAEPNFLTTSLGQGLPRLNDGFEKVKEAVEAQAGIEAIKLQQKVGWLLFLSNVAPMLGLFGTVKGMIGAFEAIVALGAKVTPKDLAIGISEALVTTFLGLLVAIPALAFYQYFRGKTTKIAIDFAALLDDMTDRFRNR